MRILITGGAGYIGSHVAESFVQQGYSDVFIIDNLSTGDKRNVVDAQLIEADIRDVERVKKILQEHKINAICHLAAATVISESIKNPLFYYDNNLIGTWHLLKAAVSSEVDYFIYSSSAAIYAPSDIPISETAACAPQHPYGHSKWMGEQLLQDVSHAGLLETAILRYFNVAGASPSGRIGQRGPATHLIKNALRTALDQQPSLPIYGTDYPTPDGTCIRDFIHVSDLAMAHVKALEYIDKNSQSLTLNCGYGKGYSVREVVSAVERLIGRPLPTTDHPRRTGDLPSVIADNRAIINTLDWEPQYTDLDKMIETAYAFEQKIL